MQVGDKVILETGWTGCSGWSMKGNLVIEVILISQDKQTGISEFKMNTYIGNESGWSRSSNTAWRWWNIVNNSATYYPRFWLTVTTSDGISVIEDNDNYVYKDSSNSNVYYVGTTWNNNKYNANLKTVYYGRITGGKTFWAKNYGNPDNGYTNDGTRRDENIINSYTFKTKQEAGKEVTLKFNANWSTYGIPSDSGAKPYMPYTNALNVTSGKNNESLPITYSVNIYEYDGENFNLTPTYVYDGSSFTQLTKLQYYTGSEFVDTEKI